ncbi:MAG TPA: DUF3800 domain-containing protein [Candidatus Saccharimonadales bacterium]|nr:DUF3800 domain-containing protein [Candidatus Saccharimonadales bacterium]
MKKIHKLHCYVDETGQDTLGVFFIVAIVVTDNQQHELEKSLKTIERLTGKKTKWMKTRDKVRTAYTEALVKEKLPAMVFVKNYHDKKDFDYLEVLATAQAINGFREMHDIREDEYKLTITVDGLSKTVAARMAAEFRKLGIKPRKIVGKKDESNAIIRLADAIAGLAREAHEGRREYQQLKNKLRRNKKLYEL